MAAVRRGVCDVVSCVARVRGRFVSVHTAPRLRGWTFNRVPRRHFRTRDTARARDRLDRCAMIVLARSGISLCATSFYLTRSSGRRPFVRCSAPLSLCTTPRRTTPPHVATAPRVASSLTRRSPHPAAPTPSGPEVTLWWRRAHAHNLCMLSYSIATRLHVGREAAIAAAAAAIAAATVVAGIAHHFADHHPAEEAHAGAHRHRAAGMVAAVVVPRVSGV